MEGQNALKTAEAYCRYGFCGMIGVAGGGDEPGESLEWGCEQSHAEGDTPVPGGAPPLAISDTGAHFTPPSASSPQS